MNSQKFWLTLYIMAVLISGCQSQSSVVTSPTEVPTSVTLPTVTNVPSITATEIVTPIPTQVPLVVSPKSCASANGQLPVISTPETSSNFGLDTTGHVENSLGGGVVQSKDFTIELLLHCDESFAHNSMEPFWLSDIDGLAVFINWRYDGMVENGPTYIIYGIEPNLIGYKRNNKEQRLYGGFGISTGVEFLSKPFPDFSKKGSLRFVYIVLFPSENFSGAVLSFDLQQVSDGLQPSNVLVTPLSDTDKSLMPNVIP